MGHDIQVVIEKTFGPLNFFFHFRLSELHRNLFIGPCTNLNQSSWTDGFLELRHLGLSHRGKSTSRLWTMSMWPTHIFVRKGRLIAFSHPFWVITSAKQSHGLPNKRASFGQGLIVAVVSFQHGRELESDTSTRKSNHPVKTLNFGVSSDSLWCFLEEQAARGPGLTEDRTLGAALKTLKNVEQP